MLTGLVDDASGLEVDGVRPPTVVSAERTEADVIETEVEDDDNAERIMKREPARYRKRESPSRRSRLLYGASSNPTTLGLERNVSSIKLSDAVPAGRPRLSWMTSRSPTWVRPGSAVQSSD
jgi:hypothetical protein